MAREFATKAAICREHGWSRYQFDLLVNEGMPVVAGAEHKGCEWQMDSAAVRRWLRERKAREELRRRHAAQQAAEWRAREEALAAERLRSEREQQNKRRRFEEARVAEIKRRGPEEQERRLLDECYSACFRQALHQSGVPLGPGWTERPQALAFFKEWPNGAHGGRPSWWLPPPGLREAVLADRGKPRIASDGEPDYSHLIPAYRPGQPWPWRMEAADV